MRPARRACTFALLGLALLAGARDATAAVRRIPKARPVLAEHEGPSRRPRQRLLCRAQLEALIRAEHGALTGPIVLRGTGRLSGIDDCPCIEYQTRDALGEIVRGRIDARLEGSALAPADRSRVTVSQ